MTAVGGAQNRSTSSLTLWNDCTWRCTKPFNVFNYHLEKKKKKKKKVVSNSNRSK